MERFCPPTSKHTAIRVIPLNRASRDHVTSRPTEFLDCEFRDCVNVAPNVAMARLHSRRHAVVGAGTFHACRLCPTAYVRKTALFSHMDSCHPPPRAEARSALCSTCGNLFRPRYLTRHMRKCQGGPKECEWCHVVISPRFHDLHRLKCPAAPHR